MDWCAPVRAGQADDMAPDDVGILLAEPNEPIAYATSQNQVLVRCHAPDQARLRGIVQVTVDGERVTAAEAFHPAG